ncbi:hypothetical protein GCM10010411_79240 [Actinomadura fulvescens]|uniref:Uncharacterized protein n=1 Tax=Actinomadura fulvescens TaxID=46160 RepID=A0ABN3QLM3_9ACTN
MPLLVFGPLIRGTSPEPGWGRPGQCRLGPAPAVGLGDVFATDVPELLAVLEELDGAALLRAGGADLDLEPSDPVA